MEVFLARQPIFNANQEVYAYEILYRSGYENKYTGEDPDDATSKVLINTFQTFGISKLTNEKPAFINFTKNLINSEMALLFSKDSLVIEVLETVIPDSRIIEKCKQLKKMGYTLVLDDFAYKPGYDHLIDLADIIKIDFLNTSKIEIFKVIRKLLNSNIKLLAEKIETHEMFEFAKKLGFSLFQGYFFSKPEIVSSNTLSPLKVNCLLLMSKINEKSINFDEIAEIISRDVSLTYYLLRLVNSSAFGFRSKINTVKHALVILGEKELKKWVMLVALNGIGKDRPDELVRLSLIRAKFAELISKDSSYAERSDDLFLMGLFSLLDVIFNSPLEEVLNDVKANSDIKDVLVNGNGELYTIFNMVLTYERGEWDALKSLAEQNNIDYKNIIQDYLDTLTWYNKVITER